MKSDIRQENMNAIKIFSKIAGPALLVWVIAIFLLWLLLWFGRDVIGALLMKLYKIFIQRNPAGL